MKRIAFIFPRFSGPYGAERHLLCLINELVKENYPVTLYTLKFHPSCKKLIGNVKIVEGGFPPIINHDVAVLLGWILMPILASKIKGHYDLIHAMNAESLVTAMIIRRFRPYYKNTPILYSCNEPPRIAYDLRELSLRTLSLFKRPFFEVVSLFIKFLDKCSIKSVDKIVSNSDWTQEQVKKIYGRDSEVVYPGIDIQRFTRFSKEEARKIIGVDREERVFISVSKLHRRKRLDKALEIYKEFSSKFGKSRLWIIGDGPEKEKLMRLAEELELQNVEFLGRTEDDDLPLFEAAADYFIFTAKDEPFGVAPLEAKVAGCELIGQQSPYPVISWEESARKMISIYDKMLGKDDQP